MASYQGVATSKLHKYMINILMRATILALSFCKMMAFIYTASLCSYSDESTTCYVCAISSLLMCCLLNNHIFRIPRDYM